MESQRTIIELDGEWRLKLDPTECGTQSNWQEGLPDSEAVDIGRPWEFWHPDYDGIGWYQCEIGVPADWTGGQIAIEFDAVMYHAECWLNGERIGSHEGGYTTFELDVSKCLKPGETNRLVVRVINPPSDREIDGFRSGAPLNQSDIPIGKSAWYYNFGGIWQGVRLIRRPACAIKALRVFPNPSAEQLRVDLLSLNADGEQSATLVCSLQTLDGEAVGEPKQFEISIAPGESRSTFEVSSAGLEAWDLQSPTQYRLKAELRIAGQTVDSLSQTFGVREFTIDGNKFVLNGKPIFINGFLHQGHYPRTLALPETREFARDELLEAKKRGFNFIRITMKPMPHWYLELADEIGLLIMHEPPIGWIANGPNTRARCLREARELAERDSNHPSVVIIGMFNESFHLLGFMPEEVLNITTDMALESRKIDPSRLIIDTSGGFSRKVLSGPDTMIHDSQSDGYQISRAMVPWSNEFFEIYDIHKYCPFPAKDADVESYRHLPGEGQLLFLAEYGAPETPPQFDEVLAEFRPDEAERQLEDWKVHQDFNNSMKERFAQSGLETCFSSVSEFIAAIGKSMANENRQIAHSIRCNPDIFGMCFCQLADASGELFGVTDIWRRPKPLYDALTSASANPSIGIHLPSRILYEGQSPDLRVSLTAEPGYRYSGTAEISLYPENGDSIWSNTVNVSEREGVYDLPAVKVDSALSTGVWNAKARFTDQGGAINEHVLEFRVLSRPESSPRGVSLRDADGRIEGYMRKAGWKIDTYGNNYRGKHMPVVLNMDTLSKNRGFYGELYGQLSKIVRLGGCAILFQPEVHALYHYLFPKLIHPQPVMRTCPYILEHPIFDSLPSGGIADYAYAEIFPKKWDKGEDVLAAGGEVIFGAFSMHMWTRPAKYFWGAGVYRVPIGKGNVIVCHLPIAEMIEHSPLAIRLLNNLVDYASSLIVPGGEQYLFARCIDPLPEEALAE